MLKFSKYFHALSVLLICFFYSVDRYVIQSAVDGGLILSGLVNCFWEFFKKPRYGEVYNIGGGRYSNCSILEALDIVENISKINIKKEFVKKNRVGDHIWYISNIEKFKKHYPNWKQKYNTRKIIDELINNIN